MRAAWVAMVLAFGLASAQEPAVTPTRLDFKVVGIGPLGPRPAVAIHTEGPWSIRVPSDAQWIVFKPSSGTGPGKVTANLVGWAVERLKAPGSYTTTATLNAGGAATPIAVSLEVVAPLPPPVFSYIAGPTGCTSGDYPDAARCAVPDEKPPGHFAPPPAGGTYVDPTFGARVRILSGPRSTHGYSAPSPISPRNTYALINLDGKHSIVKLSSGEVVGAMPASMEGAFWDAEDDDAFYYVKGAELLRYSVSTRKSQPIFDYSRPPYGFTAIRDGSRNDASKDNWIAIFAPQQSAICALDIRARKTYCGSYDQKTVGIALNASNAGVMISKGVDRASGKRYVLLNALPVATVFSVNTDQGRLDFETLGPEIMDWGGNGDGRCDPGEKCLRVDHYDTFEDSEGRQWVLGALETSVPCEYAIVSFALSRPELMGIPVELGGGRKRIMPLFHCGGVDQWTDFHIGCSKSTPFCAVSTTYTGFTGQLNPDRTEPINRTAHLSEVMVIRDNGKEVRRLMEHRSVPLAGEEAQSYWTTPRAAISNDGSYILLDSNFGEVSKNRVVVVETGFGGGRPPSSERK
ncbi:MAG TPA: hypothetical protein VGF59_04090 [Bryobacteraceae bacterium]|jgi:hypothetical protein